MRKFQWLRKDEVESLRLVETTKKEARDILARNVKALQLLKQCSCRKTMTETRLWHGCPHCEMFRAGIYDCKNCAWAEVPISCLSCFHGMYCTYQTFAGVNHDTLLLSQRFLNVSYGHDHVEVYNGGCGQYSNFSGNWNREYINCYRFLAGHIEWAIAMLDGKMPTVEVSYREKQEKVNE